MLFRLALHQLSAAADQPKARFIIKHAADGGRCHLAEGESGGRIGHDPLCKQHLCRRQFHCEEAGLGVFRLF